MGKKHKLTKAGLINLIDESREEYHVLCDSGNGYEHEYTITSYETDAGTYYSMEYSYGTCWSEELRGVNIYHLLNTGSGYEWIDTDCIGDKMDYDQFFMYTTFMRFIQKIESSGKYNTKILRVETIQSFNY